MGLVLYADAPQEARLWLRVWMSDPEAHGATPGPAGGHEEPALG